MPFRIVVNAFTMEINNFFVFNLSILSLIEVAYIVLVMRWKELYLFAVLEDSCVVCDN